MHAAKFRLRAWRDVSETADYLAVNAGAELAERFLSAMMGSVRALQQMPGIGAPCNFQRAELQGLRRWPVKDFERWLIFYKPTRSDIDIVRVLHGSLDLNEIFD
jgi:toxin ParE1/3/4